MSSAPVRNYTRLVIAVAVAAVVISASALSYSSFEATVTVTTTAATSSAAILTTTGTSGDRAFASTTNDTLGLQITLTLNSTRMTSGESINITVAYKNVLPRVLNLSAYTQDWRLTALGDDGDDYGYCVGGSAFALEVFAGHFTESNITLGAPLNADLKNALTGCGLHFSAYNVFQPLSSGRGFTDVTSGYNVQGQLLTFRPGAYTAVAGDRWGQMVILNFVVEQDAYTVSAESTYTTVSATDSTNNLQLQLSLNASRSSASGIALSATADEFNGLASSNNVTVADEWLVPLGGLDGVPCWTANDPVGLAVASGRYTSSNITAAKFLDLVDPNATYACSAELSGVQSYLFQPLTYMASVYGSCSPNPCFKDWTVSSGIMVTGYWDRQGAFTDFPKGDYTVLAEDEWGNSALAYFAVS